MALLSEKFLMNIAEKIGPPLMMRFAIQLGIKSYRIDQIKDNYMRDSIAANFAILQDWNKKERKSDAIKEFKAALKTIPELKYVSDELGPYEDTKEVVDTSNRRIMRSNSVNDIPPDLTNDDISSDLPDNGLKDATAKKHKPVKRKITANTQRKGMQKAKLARNKKAQYEVAIPDINEALKEGFFCRAQLLDLEKPHEMPNKSYTFLAVFADQDDNSIDARYYGGKGAAMRHYRKLSADSDDSERWFKISNVGIEGEHKIKGKKDADHPCRIKIKSSSRFEPIEPIELPRNPLANIEN